MSYSADLSAAARTFFQPFSLDINTDNPCSGLLLLNNADTLLYIDPPPQKASVSALPRSPECIPHRICSQKLLDTGSTYFKDLFLPRAQARTISRRGLEGKLTNGIKYVIDLTPPTVEEDAVIFLTELSCPLGIRNWAQSSPAWCSLPSALVGGQDEVELPEGKVESPSASGNTRSNAPGRKPGLPLEYSVIRHRRGIEHIIYALEGFTPELDTPCKFWTFFALARVFGVATAPKIRSLVLSWLYDPTNVQLIEHHPEIAYKIGCGIQCDYLCRDSFSVLVGEEALFLLAYSDKQPLPGKPQWTFHGRLREPLLDDDELQRIEYASKSFMEHVIDRFLRLAGSEMHWLLELPTFQELLNFTPETYMENIYMFELISTCKEYVRAHIVQWVERGNGIWLPVTGSNKDNNPSAHYKYAYSSMRYPERILCRTFWKNLMNEQFTGSEFPDIDEFFWNPSVASLGDWLPTFRAHDNATIKRVTRDNLCEIVYKFNSLVGGSKDEKLNYHPHAASPWVMEENYDPSTWLSNLFAQRKGLFDLDSFISEVRSYVTKYASDMFDLGRGSIEKTDTVTCLTENEFKYLPLWAGGNDDGTGGVFMDQDIPILETGGFSTPGPEIHLGSAASTAGSISMISTRDIESTVQGASHRTTDGYGVDYMSIQSMSICSQKDKDGVNGYQEPTSVEGYGTADDSSFLLNSSADDDEDGSFEYDSDGSDTVVLDTLSQSNDLSDFEELDLSGDNTVTLDFRLRRNN
ncbi:hypothetical protein ETB97_007998 [Aspergillus alliaceus]|uniref:Uncharacterized protein n=1 Tax=Petromyces alliaceus TaxID=209559 RepID=A0A8H5ZY82_PETAA|nr:hypothetical protein ETB97_007998 [Aspergillus burnettii]